MGGAKAAQMRKPVVGPYGLASPMPSNVSVSPALMRMLRRERERERVEHQSINRVTSKGQSLRCRNGLVTAMVGIA